MSTAGEELEHITHCPHGGWAWDGQCRCGLGDTRPVTFECTTCGQAHVLATWNGEDALVLFRHMSILGWLVELAPAVRLYCPRCAALLPPLPQEA